MVDVLVLNDAARDHICGGWRPGGAWYSLNALSGLKVPHGFVARGSPDDLSALQQLPGHQGGLQLPRPRSVEYVVLNAEELFQQCTIKCHEYGAFTDREFEQTASFLLGSRARGVLVYPEYIDFLPYLGAAELIAVDLQYLPPERREAALERATVAFGSEGLFKQDRGLVDRLVDWAASRPDRIFVHRFGPGGSRIFTGGKIFEICAFDIALRDSVGAGDVYNAAFLAARIQGFPFDECGEVAAAAAALQCDRYAHGITEDAIRHIRADAPRTFCPPEVRARCKVYLAGPFFDEGQVWVIDRIQRLLSHHGFQVFSPMHDAGVAGEESSDEAIFSTDVAALSESDMVLAVLDGEDPGTMWECGYAYARGKPVLAYCTGQLSGLNLITRTAIGPPVASNLRQLLLGAMKMCSKLCG
ncbi:MAG: PfkB family carbohydrate kinase [Bacillota bacterium]